MTSRQRFLTAVRNQIPDRVPVAPDISNYIPAKRTGLPFWEIYFYNRLPLYQAYADAAIHFGIDWWIGASASIPAQFHNQRVEYRCTDRFDHAMDAMVRDITAITPDGAMTETQVCGRAEPPTSPVKLIKNVADDFPRFRWMLAEPTGLDHDTLEQMRSLCHRHGQAFGLCHSYPGFQNWIFVTHGGVEALTYAFADHQEILDEWHEQQLARDTRVLELFLATRPDYVLLGGSGTLTLASPQLVRRYALPAIKKWSAMCRAAGVATMLHSCGRSRLLVDMLAEETDVNLINPLEHAPMGDVDLAEVKLSRGRQIALMGNLHTTQAMLHGSEALVRRRAVYAMKDGGSNGGFILSTGDQCPRETPERNIFALVETAHQYGTYDNNGYLPSLKNLDLPFTTSRLGA